MHLRKMPSHKCHAYTDNIGGGANFGIDKGHFGPMNRGHKPLQNDWGPGPFCPLPHPTHCSYAYVIWLWRDLWLECDASHSCRYSISWNKLQISVLKNIHLTIPLPPSSSVNYTPIFVQMSHVTRKPVFCGLEQVRLKPACSATEASYNVKVWIYPVQVLYYLGSEQQTDLRLSCSHVAKAG